MLNSSERLAKFLAAAILASFLMTSAACSDSADANRAVDSNASGQNANTANANSAKDDIEELGMIIKLPETPEDVVWREEKGANPNDKNLTAVLKYNSEAAAKIVASAEKKQPAAAVEISAEAWFPEELIAQSQLSGNESLKGIAYAANDFYNSPYQNGKLTRVDGTNYFVLELTAY